MSRKRVDRRTFLRIAGASLGVGALYRVLPALAEGGEAKDVARSQVRAHGEAVTPFTFVQLSDTHVGFEGPPNPTGTRAFERAVEIVRGLKPIPDLVLFTGDLTHDSEKPGEAALRMRRFREIAGRIEGPTLHLVPGEHDAGLDGGKLYHEVFGDSSYSFDHRGIHFVALDNVSRAKPEVGPEQLAWLERDLARFEPTAPIVVFTHRPLFDLRPDWEWFTRDGDAVMRTLSRFENVTVLYGHIHREHTLVTPHVRHYAARSLIFAFPDPAGAGPKVPLPFDPERPFRGLGLRRVRTVPGNPPDAVGVSCEEIELSLAERSGTEGFQQLLRPSSL